MGNRRSNMVSISPSGGGVMCGDKQKCILSFCPPKRTTLKDSELVLKVIIIAFYQKKWQLCKCSNSHIS